MLRKDFTEVLKLALILYIAYGLKQLERRVGIIFSKVKSRKM